MKRLAAIVSLVVGAVASTPGMTATCPDGIGASAGDAPKVVFDMGNGALLLVCGWEEDERGAKALFRERRVFSEFDIVDPATQASVLRFHALQLATFQKSGPILRVTEYKIYPLGEDFSYMAVPFSRHTLRQVEGHLQASCELVMESPRFTSAQLGRIDAMYQRVKNRGPELEDEDIGVLVVLAAMAGSSKYESLLPTAGQELRLDGHLSEDFHATLRDLQEIRSGHCGGN